MAESRVIFCTIVPLDTSSGGTIVCREHVTRLAGLPDCRLHVIAPAAAGTAEWLASLGATFEPMIIGPVPETPVDDGLRGEAWPGFGASRRGAFMFEQLAMEHPALDRLMHDAVASFRPTWIVLDYLYTSLFVPSAFSSGVPVAVVNLNREREFFHQQRLLRRVPAGAADTGFAEWRLGRFEQEACRLSTRWVVLSENDLPRDPALAGRGLVIKPVLEGRSERWQFAGGRNLFFVGNINHYPNYGAVQWLCTALAPALQAQGSDLRITIIGAAPDEVPAAWHAPNVDLLGRSTSEEVLRQFCSCGLFVAPIENDFGAKIKILEALAHRTPLAATPAALSGLVAREGIPAISMADAAGAARLLHDLVASREALEQLSGVMDRHLAAQAGASAEGWASMVRESPQPPRVAGRSMFLRPRRLRPKGNSLEVCRNGVWIASSGWNANEALDGRPLRWSSRESSFTVPLDAARPPRWLHFRFRALTPAGGMPFQLSVNGHPLLSHAVTSPDLEGFLPLPPLATGQDATLVLSCPGFQIPGDARVLGVAVEFLRLLWKLPPGASAFDPDPNRPSAAIGWRPVEIGLDESGWRRSAGFGPIEWQDERPFRRIDPAAEIVLGLKGPGRPRWLQVRVLDGHNHDGRTLRVISSGEILLEVPIRAGSLAATARLPDLGGRDELSLRLETSPAPPEDATGLPGLPLASLKLSRTRLLLR